MTGFMSFGFIDESLSRCMSAFPPEGVEKRLHPDANKMADVWCRMVLEGMTSIETAAVNDSTLEAIERWRR